MLRRRRVTYGGHVAQVEPGSIAEEIGIRPGDLLVSINGHPLRDVIDYQFYGAEEELELHIRRGNRVHRVQVERGYEEDLGLRFTEPLFDGLRECVNRCPFCFVAQMPRGLRRSLYVRDDDYRLSFLQGTFVTLTNLEEDDWQRIGEQHLSPLYVSIHATDLRVRRALLGNPHAPDIMAQLRRLERINITVHGQIVIVPGQNDGAILEQTVRSLLNLWPTVQSLAVVPVGLTRLCREPLRTLTPAEATDVLALVGRLEMDIRQRTGRTWLYPSDEMYLLAGVDVPGSGAAGRLGGHQGGPEARCSVAFGRRWSAEGSLLPPCRIWRRKPGASQAPGYRFCQCPIDFSAARSPSRACSRARTSSMCCRPGSSRMWCASPAPCSMKPGNARSMT